MEVLTHLTETNARHSSLADKTVQKQKKTKIESGASYTRNWSKRVMWHSRAAHCLSQITCTATFHFGVHIHMFITLQLQPAWAAGGAHTAGGANMHFQNTAARQTCSSTLRGSLLASQQQSSLAASSLPGWLVKSLSENRTQNDIHVRTNQLDG